MYKNIFILAMLFSLASDAMQPNTFIASVTGFNTPYAIATTPNSLYAYVTDGTDIRVIDTNPSSPSFNTLIDAPGLESILTNAPSLAIAPNGLFGYVVDAGSNSVLVINTDPSSSSFNTLVAAPALIGTFSNPGGVAITPDSTRAYVINAGNNTVNVIDTDPTSVNFNTILSTPGLDGILIDPFDIAITPNGLYAYVSNFNGTVSVIDTNPASPTYNTLLAAPGLASVNPQPEGLAITADGLFAYVSDGSANDVTALDINPASPTYNTVLSAPNLQNAFNSPNDVATTSVGNLAYVTNFLGSNGDISSVVVIDTNPANSTFNTTLDTPGLNQGSLTARYFTLAATPNARYVYAVDGYNAVVNVIYTGIIIVYEPANVSGCYQKNIFLSQTAYSTVLTWTAPTLGNPPVVYNIYSDAGLTHLVATIPASDALQYVVPGSNPNVITVYYIVSVDDSGNTSTPAVAIVSNSCS